MTTTKTDHTAGLLSDVRRGGWYRGTPLWIVLVTAFAVLEMTVTERAAGTDWPQWRGPQRDALSVETGLPSEWPADGPAKAWQADGLGGGYSSVIVGNGRIFTMGRKETDVNVTALDERTGQKIWTRKIGETSRHPSSTPTLDGELLYVLEPDGELFCLQATSGEIVWSVSLVEKFAGRMMSGRGYGESPLIDGEKLICTPGGADAAMVAMDKRTGAVLWQSALKEPGPGGKDGAGFSSVVVSEAAGVRQYVQLMGRGLVGIDAQDGRHLWSFNDIANGTANIPTPVVRDDYIFAANGYSAGSVLLRLSPEPAAGSGRSGIRANVVYTLSAGEFQNHHGGVVLIGDYLFGGHGNNSGLPTCLEFKTGRIVWKRRGPGVGSAAIVAAEGHLYFRYQNGVVALIEATSEGYRVKGRLQVAGAGGDSWAHPVVANGRLYLREQDVLWVYDLTGERTSVAPSGQPTPEPPGGNAAALALRSAGVSADILTRSDARTADRPLSAGAAEAKSERGRDTISEMFRYVPDPASAESERPAYRVVFLDAHLTPEGTLRDELLQQLHDVPGDVYVSLAGTAVTDAGIAQLAAAKIAGLSLELCTGVTETGFRVLPRYVNLKILILTGTRVSAEDVGELASLRQLAALDLGLCEAISDSSCGSLGKLSGLRALDFRKTGFEKNRITGAGLSRLRDLTNLEMLVLYGNQVTDPELAELAPLLRLRQLDLSLLPITDAGMPHLAVLRSLEQLDLLYSEGFAGPMLTDSGIVFLAGMSQLQRLNLTGARLTDDGLTPLMQLSRLRTLQLVRTGVSVQGLDAFQKAVPGCRVVR